MTNIIESIDREFYIIVPACTREWADIKISFRDKTKQHRWGNSSVQRKIDLKTFRLADGELDRTRPGSMPFHAYWALVLNHKQEIIELCERLNGGDTKTCSGACFPDCRFASECGVHLDWANIVENHV